MDKYNQKWVNIFKRKKFKAFSITLGQTSYFTCDEIKVDKAWHKHEDKHKEQWKRDGRIKFSIRYLWWSLRYGYYNNPYEIEAREAEKK